MDRNNWRFRRELEPETDAQYRVFRKLHLSRQREDEVLEGCDELRGQLAEIERRPWRPSAMIRQARLVFACGAVKQRLSSDENTNLGIMLPDRSDALLFAVLMSPTVQALFPDAP